MQFLGMVQVLLWARDLCQKSNIDASTDAVYIGMFSSMGTGHYVIIVREQAQGTSNLTEQE